MTISEEIRQIIRDSGVSLYALGKHTGINEAVLWRFMNGKTLTMTTLDRIAPALGIRLFIDEPEYITMNPPGRPRRGVL